MPRRLVMLLTTPWCLSLCLHCCLPLTAAEIEPVRMGCGIMTFDTAPGWGLDDSGQSQIGSTHGSVVVDSKGQVYTS